MVEHVSSSPEVQLSSFSTDLLLGMHAMAQPLTLLQSHFYLAQAGIVGSQSKQLTLYAAAGAEHLCLLFRLMQELMLVQSVAANSSAISLELVIASLREDAEAIFAGTGARLAVESGWPQALAIDPARTRQALISMVHMLKEEAPPRSVVSCQVTQAGAWIDLLFRLSSAEGPRAESPRSGAAESEKAQLYAALARAGLVSQRGVFCTCAWPPTLAISLPVVAALSGDDFHQAGTLARLAEQP